MARQAETERERRSKIIAAEGDSGCGEDCPGRRGHRSRAGGPPAPLSPIAVRDRDGAQLDDDFPHPHRSLQALHPGMQSRGRKPGPGRLGPGSAEHRHSKPAREGQAGHSHSVCPADNAEMGEHGVRPCSSIPFQETPPGSALWGSEMRNRTPRRSRTTRRGDQPPPAGKHRPLVHRAKGDPDARLASRPREWAAACVFVSESRSSPRQSRCSSCPGLPGWRRS